MNVSMIVHRDVQKTMHRTRGVIRISGDKRLQAFVRNYRLFT